MASLAEATTEGNAAGVDREAATAPPEAATAPPTDEAVEQAVSAGAAPGLEEARTLEIHRVWWHPWPRTL